jgi:hypothetical protein
MDLLMEVVAIADEIHDQRSVDRLEEITKLVIAFCDLKPDRRNIRETEPGFNSRPPPTPV